jgi:hypothetical protein
MTGGGAPDVDGGVDCVGQFALASITDPSGHVFVVGDVGVPDVGGVVVDGATVCVHDGSFGFFVQSTGGAVPEVQLFTHIDPVPDPLDDGIDVLLGHVVLSLHVDGGGIGVIPCSFASCMSQSAVLRFLSRSVLALLSARSHGSGGVGGGGGHGTRTLSMCGPLQGGGGGDGRVGKHMNLPTKTRC